ncbi:Fcf2 pre-rRNA processing-domain-containing protein [Bisporella sp. PMI_857]|nr:Fcf2 pre-rRNA processing-domain-containing protein [Bisporella sp. PMI_857]
MAEEEHSDEQLFQLLKDAEQRLKSSKKVQATRTQSLPSLQQSISKGSENQIKSYLSTTNKSVTVDPAHLVSTEERKQSSAVRVVVDPATVKAKAAHQWYNLPKTTLTPELKRDLQLLHMRGVLDPKRHYKKEGSKPKIPEFSQVGTIIEGPTEFLTGRLTNKERKRTLVEEILETEKSSGRFKNKYGEIQVAKTSGKKDYYKALKAKRSGRVSKG